MSSFISWRRVLLVGFALLFGVAAVAALVGWWRFDTRREQAYAVPPMNITVTRDSSTLARGEHLARTLAGCAECHGEDFGGRVLDEDAFMRVVAPNLTGGSGSAVRDFSDVDWFRAIVHGTTRSGRSLFVMPTSSLRAFSDEDISAVVAFCRTLRPVDRDLGRTEVSLLGTVVLGLANAKVFSAEGFDHRGPDVRAPKVASTPEYGRYLANTCRGCHGHDLRGGVEVKPGSPPSADISPQAMAGWSFSDFVRVAREGKRRDGTALDPIMPWRALSGLTDEEVRALWLGLRQK